MHDKSDIWERSKECAAQAEKVVQERNSRSIANGGHGVDDWSDHYSLKFNRCYVKFDFFVVVKEPPKGIPLTMSYLLDAFERSNIAVYSDGIRPEVACRSENDAEACERRALPWWTCTVQEKTVACEDAKRFMDEHMKN